MIPIVEVESILYSSSGVALLVDTSSGAQALRIVGSDGTGVSTKDESAIYGAGVNSLDVNIRSGIVQVKLTGENLRYSKLVEDQALPNGSYTTIYSNTSTGKVIWFRCLISNNDVNIKVTVDSNIIINDFNMQELYKDYHLDTSYNDVTGLDFIHTEQNGKVLVLNFPGGMEFNSSFNVELKSNQNNVSMTRGLVVWAGV